jgi:hypothetical protein
MLFGVTNLELPQSVEPLVMLGHPPSRRVPPGRVGSDLAGADLRIELLERGQMQPHLLGQLAQVTLLVVREACLLFIEALPRVGELLLQLREGVARALFAHAQILPLVEGREVVRDVGRDPRIPRRVGHVNRDRDAAAAPLFFVDVDADVLLHLIDEELGGSEPFHVRIELEAHDQGIQPRAAQVLALQRAQPRIHVVVGHSGSPLDQHDCGRSVGPGHEQRKTGDGRDRHRERKHGYAATPTQDLPYLFQQRDASKLL